MFRIRLLAGWVLLLAAPFTAPAETVLIQLQVIEGEGAIHTARTKASRPITVQVTDETGKPVGGAGVTFRLPEENASGFFDTGLRSDVQITGHDGRASVWSILWGNVAGPVKIRVTASKDTARAGTIVSQYLNEPSANTPAPVRPPEAEEKPVQTGTVTASIRPAIPAIDPEPKPVIAPKRRTNTRWLLIGAAAGGAVAVALLAGKGGVSATQSTGGSATPPIPTISIGSPTISVGKP